MLNTHQDENALKPPACAEVRKQERSLLTRQQLVDAARKIFARDGFERARLQDISALAGKTRGAFYANFKNKEDAFFAIFEQDLLRDQEHFRRALKRASTKEKRILAVSSYLVKVVHDKERMLLMLEFKLYVLRQPQEQKRLSDLHLAICERGVGSGLGVLLPELSPQPGSAVRRRQMAQLGAIVDGLALNRLFDPDSFNRTILLAQALAAVRAAMK